MKFRVQMKDPDTLHDSIRIAVEEQVGYLNLPLDEAEVLCEKRREKIADICSRWFRYGEYLTVEIDTDAKTCTVVADE